MRSDIRPLPIWSARELTDADYTRIRRAKQQLGLPFLVQFGKAVAGGWERVLAIGGEPPFLCEYAQIPNTYSSGLGSALEWVLTDKEDSRAMLMADVLSKWMGAEVREITDATDEQQQHMADPLGNGPRGSIDPNLSDDGDYRSHIRTRPSRDGL